MSIERIVNTARDTIDHGDGLIELDADDARQVDRVRRFAQVLAQRPLTLAQAVAALVVAVDALGRHVPAGGDLRAVKHAAGHAAEAIDLFPDILEHV